MINLIQDQNFDLIMALADHQWDMLELIFGFLNHDTVEICRKVSKDWDKSLEKISSVKFLEEFGHKKVLNDRGPMEKVLTVIPGWQRAVKKYAAQATNEDLMEVQEAVAKLVRGDDKCWSYRYPVHHAAENGNVKLLKLILMTSYDMNTGDWNGKTPLHWACINGEIEVIELFFQSSKEFGIDLNATDVQGWTPLHWVCFYGKKGTFQWFLQCSKEHEVDLNARNDRGRTVLHLACMFGKSGAVKLIMNNLKEFAIDIKDAQDKDGNTALDLIENCMKKDIVEKDDFIECSKILRQKMQLQKRCV